MVESRYWSLRLARTLSRRGALEAGAATGAGLFLAACGSSNNNTSKPASTVAKGGSAPAGSPTIAPTSAAQPKQGGTLTFGTTNSSQYNA